MVGPFSRKIADNYMSAYVVDHSSVLSWGRQFYEESMVEAATNFSIGNASIRLLNMAGSRGKH